MSPAVNTPAAPTLKKPSRWWRYLRLALIAYLLVLLMLSLLQRWIIFPGAALSHGESARLFRPQGSELLDLPLVGGGRAAALFCPAREGGLTVTDTRRHPTIIYFYGNAQCLAWSLDEVELFRSSGFNVLVGDYPGFGLTPGKAGEAGCYALADALWTWASGSPQVDPSRIVVGGWSLGSGVAVDLASRRPAAGLFTLSAYTSIDELAREQFPFFPTSCMLEHHFRSLEKLPRVRCPVLLVHGDHDSIVPSRMLPRLAAAVTSGSPRTLMVDSDHNDIIQRGWNEISQQLVRLRESLPNP